ncbi:MAG: RNA polymerase sigma factor [Planctomycetota bacterium]
MHFDLTHPASRPWAELGHLLGLGRQAWATFAVRVEPNDWGFEEVEAELVGAARAGDDDAFQQLVDRYQATLSTQMRRYSRNQNVVESLVHDVFVEAFLSLGSFRGNSPFEHWLRKIAVRVGYRHWKRDARDKRLIQKIRDKPVDAAIMSEQATDAVDARDQLHAVLEKLSPRDRLVLTLLYWDGNTVAEAAALTGWTQTMVKVQAHRARKRLKRILEDPDET